MPWLEQGEISIDVIDNSSEYDVLLFFKSYIDSGVNITINRTNIGGDRNIFSCYSRYSNGWIWVLSDNDILKENSVEYVLELLNRFSDCSFISLNNPKQTVGFGFEDFSRMTYYPNMFTISNMILRIEKFDITSYRERIDTNQGHFIGLIRGMRKEEESFYISSYDPFQVKKMATWDRQLFLKNEVLNFLDGPEKEYISYQKKNRLYMHVMLIYDLFILNRINLTEFVTLILRSIIKIRFVSMTVIGRLVFRVFRLE